MQRSSKFFLSALLALILVILFIPASAFASGEHVSATAPSYRMTSIDGTSVTNSYAPGNTKLFVFYRETCGNCQYILDYISESDWADNSDLSVIAPCLDTTTLSEIRPFAEKFDNKKILFCSDPFSSAWSFLRAAGYTDSSCTTPMIFIVDPDNKIRYYSTGFITEAALREHLSKYVSSIKSPKTTVSVKGYTDYDYANEALSLINRQRANNGLSAYKMNSELLSSAMRRAAECSIYYSNSRPDGNSALSVGSAHSGTIHNAFINNIAGTPSAFVSSLPANIILDNSASVAGIGCFYQGGNMYWTILTGSGYTSAASTKTDYKEVTYSVPVLEAYLQPQLRIEDTYGVYHMRYYPSDTIPVSKIKSGSSLHFGVYNINTATGDEIRLSASSLSVSSSSSAIAEVANSSITSGYIDSMMYDFVSGKKISGKSLGSATIKVKLKNTDLGFSIPVKITSALSAPSFTLKNGSSSGKPYLDWNSVSGAAKYEVYRYSSSTGKYTRIKTTSSTSYSDTEAIPGKYYKYKIRALTSAGGYSAYSAVKSITCDCAKPTVTLTTKSSSGKPYLTWKAISGAEKYEVYRATSKNGTYTRMLTTTKTSYTNTSASPGRTYYYKVKAICGRSSYGNSRYSTVKSVTCDCARPVVTAIRSSKNGKPYLYWDAVSGAKEYRIYRSTSKNSGYERIYTTSKTHYNNTGAKSGKTYYYKVQAVCGRSSYGNSAYSYYDSVTSR